MPHRIALVGCGPWSEHILRDLQSLGAEVQVVARHESSRARAVQGGASRIVSSVSELHPADGIVIARETVSHAEAIFDCVPFGVPIFVEKPMTHSVESAAAIAAMSDAGARIFVMDKWRYHPGIEALADLARSQKYGKVVGLRCRRNWWGNPHSDVSALWIYVPHDLSIALEILGQISDPQYAIGDVHGVQVRGIQGVLGSHPWFSFESHSRSHKLRTPGDTSFGRCHRRAANARFSRSRNLSFGQP